jgi:hypothetical protein
MNNKNMMGDMLTTKPLLLDFVIMHFYGIHNGKFLWVSQVLFYSIQMHVKNLTKTKKRENENYS